MTAAMLGPLRPQINRFKLGTFEITTILDGQLVMPDFHPIFAHDQPESVARAYAKKSLLPIREFVINFTPTLVNTGRELVLFDTGHGATKRQVGMGNLRNLLPAAGYSPEDIDIIAFTHCHPDHISGVMENDLQAFPNASYVIGQVEYDAWFKGDLIPSHRQPDRELFMKLIPPLAEKMSFLASGEDVVSGITAIQAYGHSPGHMAYMIESHGESALLWGDITNHYALSLQMPEWKVGFDDDKDVAVATRKRILDMAATDRLVVIGHHMPFPSLGYVERWNGSYRWLPASYQMNV